MCLGDAHQCKHNRVGVEGEGQGAPHLSETGCRVRSEHRHCPCRQAPRLFPGGRGAGGCRAYELNAPVRHADRAHVVAQQPVHDRERCIARRLHAAGVWPLGGAQVL